MTLSLRVTERYYVRLNCRSSAAGYGAESIDGAAAVDASRTQAGLGALDGTVTRIYVASTVRLRALT